MVALQADPPTIQPRWYILDGMQGVVSANDLGGANEVNGMYKDPSSGSLWSVAVKSQYTVRVVKTTPGSADSETECWICWSCTGLAKDSFFADTEGVHISFEWKVRET